MGVCTVVGAPVRCWLALAAVALVTDEQLLSDILRREGSVLTDDPTDEGGVTRFGLTLPLLSLAFGRPATRADLERMDEGMARAIYRTIYVEPWAFIPDSALRACIVDLSVNFGMVGGTKFVQRHCGVKPDGRLGPVTRKAVLATDARLMRCGLIRAAADADIREAIREAQAWVKAHGVDPGALLRKTDLRFVRGWVHRRLEHIL